MIQIKSRTRQGALVVRVFVNGTADLPKARETQSGFQAMPAFWAVLQTPSRTAHNPCVSKHRSGDSILRRARPLNAGPTPGLG
jgi:hypothetical protein